MIVRAPSDRIRASAWSGVERERFADAVKGRRRQFLDPTAETTATHSRVPANPVEQCLSSASSLDGWVDRLGRTTSKLFFHVADRKTRE